MEKSDVSYYPSVNFNCVTAQNASVSHDTNPIYVTFCGIVITAMLVNSYVSFSENDLSTHNSMVQSYDSADTNNNGTNCFFFSPSFAETQKMWFFSESDHQKSHYAAQENRAGGILSMLNREIPISFLIFNLLSTLLFLLTIYLLWFEFSTGSFVFNPIYLLEFAVGFLGLLVTSLVAIFEWRRKRGWKERGIQ